MKVVVLASGSLGNATYIMGKKGNILIDAGISRRQILNRLSQVGISSFDANAILITHEHCDHTSQLPGVLGNYDVTYYITEKSFYALNPRIFNGIKDKMHVIINPMETFEIAGIKVSTIDLSHDSMECLGYILEEDGKKVVYVADTGYLHQDYYSMLKGADVYLMEANHDPYLLMNSNRPMLLKKRILGDNGHMSNQDGAAAICYLADNNTKAIFFMHRSKECNDLETLKETVEGVFEDFSLSVNDFDVLYAEQDYPTKIVEV